MFLASVELWIRVPLCTTNINESKGAKPRHNKSYCDTVLIMELYCYSLPAIVETFFHILVGNSELVGLLQPHHRLVHAVLQGGIVLQHNT